MSSPCGKAGRVTPKKNLTGSARHVKDLAADIHLNIQKWNQLHLRGFDVLKSIVQKRECKRYDQSLQKHCDELESVYDLLNEVAEKLGEISRQITILMCLHKCTEKIFDTWSMKKCGETVEKIYNAYRAELEVKHYVVANVAHDTGENSSMLYLASWAVQPLLPNDLILFVEAMLTGTGHR